VSNHRQQTFMVATCVNYAVLYNSMLCMLFRCDVLILQSKHNGLRHMLLVASAYSEFFE